MSIQDIFKTLKKRWKLIRPLTFSTQILVNQKENQLDSIQIKSNIDMINTYSVIIKSPAILGKVIGELDLGQSVDQLSEKITINSQENSQVFSLTVQDSNPTKAVEIANTVSETFQKEIKDEPDPELVLS
ncbi:YveK family protein [Peribacillus frigoritolerans]|uniref:YveK family protein n=1 Tax=Peribacillus castrilensis TaxID=2897690 RepID=UPI00346073DA